MDAFILVKKKKVSAETCVCNIFSLAHCKQFPLTLDLKIRTVWIFYQLSVLSFFNYHIVFARDGWLV